MALAVAKEFPDVIVLQCRTAAEALSILRTEKVDALITDNRMPEMTGIEMIRQIRRQDCLIPILMVTGTEQLRAAAFEAGVSSFTSSGSWEEVRRRIREFVREQPRDS